MRDWGTGGKYQQVTQALTGPLKGALGGDITQALANGSAPYLAEAIKKATTNPDGSVNTEANLAAHAILGALLSQANDNSALAGGLGALSAEAAANLIKNELYGDKSFADLTEDERQNISALSQIAAAVAGGLTGDSSSDAAQGAIIGKNAVDNNFLTPKEKAIDDKRYDECETNDCRTQVAIENMELFLKNQSDLNKVLEVFNLEYAERFKNCNGNRYCEMSVMQSYAIEQRVILASAYDPEAFDVIIKKLIAEVNAEAKGKKLTESEYNDIIVKLLLRDNAEIESIIERSPQNSLIKKAGYESVARTVADFIPVIGDAKGFYEAEDSIDLLIAAVALIPGLGDAAGKTLKEAKVLAKNGDYAGANKLINDVKVEIKNLDSGSTGNWNKDLNKPKPNTVYNIDENKIYRTDELGRVNSVEADLTLLTNDRNTYQQCKIGKCGEVGDGGGHLIASIFNGPGEALNLTPMALNLNRGDWKAMENIWAKALKEGKNVKVDIQPIYSGNGARANEFKVNYWINGKLYKEVFKNE
ncbi:DNA/RNA non-specific endonuclease [Thorsellia kenyensis]|uniref:DNA/RNA non-specific endonuclease n=1 Tax=Thorsellia kenyensis TaxID=1549888 RepID=A0ABV6CDE6_9GAMM